MVLKLYYKCYSIYNIILNKMPRTDNEVAAGRPNARRKVMGIFYQDAITPRLKEIAPFFR